MTSMPRHRVRIDYSQRPAAFRHTWNATGMTPAALLLGKDMEHYLDMLAGVPGSGVRWHRSHFMFDLIEAQRTATGLVYDWTLLDRALDNLVERGMKPFFEVMGNPSGMFTDFEDRAQLAQWRELVARFAQRCAERYGADELRSWYFETWNEPDVGWWRYGDQGYLNYYDWTVAGLEDFDAALRIGGPGTALTLSPMFKLFVGHCDKGTNSVTGATGTRLDFISVHEKGAWFSLEDLTPRSLWLVEKEMQVVDYLRAHHPRLAALPFINDECDPQVGWLDAHTYHALPYYAAYLPRIVEQHNRIMGDEHGVDHAMLVNDNGFLGGWGHRTLIGYFGPRALTKAQIEHQTDLATVRAELARPPEAHELIKKPVLAAMELMGLLGDTIVPVAWEEGSERVGDEVKIFATGRPDGVALLVFSGVDSPWTSGRNEIALQLAGLPNVPHHVAIFAVDADHGNPFDMWDRAGGPAEIAVELFDRLRASEGPAQIGEVAHLVPSTGQLVLPLSVLLPSVSLVVLERATEPPRIGNLVARSYPGQHDRETLTLSWRNAGGGFARYDIFAQVRGERVKLGGNQLALVFRHSRVTGPIRYEIVAKGLDGSSSAPLVIEA